jgi:myo-inositol-1(or 4)-monophosphatase
MVRAAREGGRIVRRHFFSRRIQYREKSSPGDLVSNVDLQVERKVLGILRREFPGIAVVSEEGQDTGIKPEAFYVDPLDGTLNFVHGLRPFAVSLGYWKDGLPVAAVVYNPLSGELFSALRGGGALRNGKPISPSAAAELRNSLLATGWPYEREERARLFAQMDSLYLYSQELRGIGCASLFLCYVASGIFDGYWEWGLKPWDIAAGALIVTEAGGQLSSLTGDVFRLEDGGIAASNGRIHAELIERLNAHDPR